MKIRKIRIGDIFESCGYHPCICVENDGYDVVGISLVDGREKCCSLEYCQPFKLTKVKSAELVEMWRVGGEKLVLMNRGLNEEQADNFLRVWRKK